MTNKSLTGKRVVDEIMKCGITHIVWLPDSDAQFMYDAMSSQPGLTLVPMCREGEGIAIAAGLIIAGKKAMVLHQNTGFFESGDSVRDLALDLQLPLLLMLGYVGWQRDVPMTNSAGVYLEPILDAWGIKHYLLETDDDVEKISMAYKETNETKRPVAVLITKEYQSECKSQTGKVAVRGTTMDCIEAEKVISRHRHGAIVITAQTADHEWPQISSDPDLDIAGIHCMGKASSLGLGLALALPGKKVIVLDADGALLMNLGSLVTIANMAPTNLIHFVMENGIYRTTGGQPIPGAGKFSFSGLAKDAGYHHVYEFDNLEDLENSIETIMKETGPTFVCLKVPPLIERSLFPRRIRSDAMSLSSQLRKALLGVPKM